MTTYVYKSTTGKTVNIDSFTITTNPGLELKYANDVLDSYIGINLARYDNGVLLTADDSTPVNAKVNPLTGEVGFSSGGTTLPAPAFVHSGGPYRKKLLVFGCSIAQQCNAYLHSETSTTSAAVIPAGSTAITVLNGAAFTIGHKVTVPLYNGRLWTTTISNIVSNTLTVADPTPAMIRASVAITDHVLPTTPALDQGLGAVNAAVVLLGGPVEVLPVYGYGGAIFQQMWCDLERDLRYYKPQYCALHMYENDLTGTVAGGSATITQMIGWAKAMARLCLSYGATPIVYSSMPYYKAAGPVGIPTSRAADYDALAAYVGSGTSGQLSVDVPGAYGDNSVSTAWLDPAYINNGTYSRRPLPGWTDGVHPNTDHRFAIGLIAAPVLKTILPAADSLLDMQICTRDTASMALATGGVSGLIGGSIAPKNHTIAAYGTAASNASTSRNADGSIKIIGAWPGAANRSNDYIADFFMWTVQPSWTNSTQRFKVYCRVRVNSMAGIAQIYPNMTLSTGESHTGMTGVDMCTTMPADGRIMLMETPTFAIGAGATSIKLEVRIHPTTAGSPANAAIDIDILELGLVPVMPETPHSFI